MGRDYVREEEGACDWDVKEINETKCGRRKVLVWLTGFSLSSKEAKTGT